MSIKPDSGYNGPHLNLDSLVATPGDLRNIFHMVRTDSLHLMGYLSLPSRLSTIHKQSLLASSTSTCLCLSTST